MRVGTSMRMLYKLQEIFTANVHILSNFSTPWEGNFSGRMAVTSPPLWKLSSPVKWQ
ncbi:hypothetical protein HRE53_28050 (plasmid) [Acaryochloris sp. 'Moss Beach']|uniref:hypothetical protein n=1 Tax=Acaryochloris sp. 'Moss Beach' TaxID=2740837 RepID=UPI001F2EB45C|nr:hypothetical protein [Acaryochloris sp. 'Moss Beach']UJB72672.1 hypothetical protein HRE53_28050 [Acaryochloris sp. 'Moss Beach']